MKHSILKATIFAVAANVLVWTLMIMISEAGSVSVAHTRNSLEAVPSPPLPIPSDDPNDVFDRYLSTDIPPADGFDYPVGDANGEGEYTDPKTGKVHQGWYVSTRFGEWYSYGVHPAEDWNGVGGTNTDFGQPVHAIGNGKVIFAGDCGQPSGGVVVIQHVYYLNHEKRRIRSVYVHLGGLKVSEGQTVHRRQEIGTIGKDPKGRFYAHLHFEMRLNESLKPTFWPSAAKKNLEWIRANYVEPSAFIRSHRQLFVPSREQDLVLVDRASNRMRLYRSGRPHAEYPVSFGRGWPESDRSAPGGMYFVVSKQRVRIENRYIHAEDAHRLRLNYPNRFDAARDRSRGLLTPGLEAQIEWAWRQRKPTAGIHPESPGLEFEGWSEQSGDRFPSQLPAGKIVMHKNDIRDAYPRISEGTMVVIF